MVFFSYNVQATVRIHPIHSAQKKSKQIILSFDLNQSNEIGIFLLNTKTKLPKINDKENTRKIVSYVQVFEFVCEINARKTRKGYKRRISATKHTT